MNFAKNSKIPPFLKEIKYPFINAEIQTIFESESISIRGLEKH
jgi:hypothetical protein